MVTQETVEELEAIHESLKEIVEDQTIPGDDLMVLHEALNGIGSVKLRWTGRK